MLPKPVLAAARVKIMFSVERALRLLVSHNCEQSLNSLNESERQKVSMDSAKAAKQSAEARAGPNDQTERMN